MTLLVASLVLALGAEPSTRRPPVRIDAEEVRYSYKDRTVTFVGRPSVRLTREDATLTCRQAIAENDAEGRIVRATCSGDVRLIRGTRTVTCETAVYVEASSQVTCRGMEGRPVLLADGPSTVAGRELVYDLDRDLVTLRGQVVGDIVPPERMAPRSKGEKR